MKYKLDATPMGAVRQTKSDAWKARPEVLRYRAFSDLLRLEAQVVGLILPDVFTVEFYLPMSKSWSKKKRELYKGVPHQQKPDLDNMLKGFLDSLLKEDCRVWKVTASKFWTEDTEDEEGYIIIDTNA